MKGVDLRSAYIGDDLYSCYCGCTVWISGFYHARCVKHNRAKWRDGKAAQMAKLSGDILKSEDLAIEPD